MFGAGLHGGGQRENLLGCPPVGGGYRGDGEVAGGQGAGLVEDDGVDGPDGLQCAVSLEEDAQLRAAPGGHHHGRRGRQPECARAGDDQHGQRCRERLVCAGTGDQPATGGQCGDHEHRRHEHAGNAVGQPLGIGLVGLGLFDQAHHPGEMGVSPDGRGLHDEAPVEHHGSADHAGAGGHARRRGFAGHGTHIDGGASLHHKPVGGDRLTRPDDEALLFLELFCGKDHFGAVGHQHGDALGTQRGQCPQRVAGLGFGPRLEVAAGQHEHRHPGGHLEVDRVAAHQRPPHAFGPALRMCDEDRVQRPQRGGGDPHRDQGFHRGDAVARVAQRHPVEGPRRPGDDRQRQPHQDPLPAGEAGRGQNREHHRQMRQRHEQHRRHRQTYQQRAGRGVVGVRTLVTTSGAHLTLISRPCHHVAQLRGGQRRRRVDGGHPGGVVHRRAHAVELVQAGLDPGRTRRARHARHVELDAADRRSARPFGDGRGHRPPQCARRARRTALTSRVGSSRQKVPVDGAKTTRAAHVPDMKPCLFALAVVQVA